MRYKFTNFVDAIEVALDAWYFSRYGSKRDKKLSTEVMALFMRDVDGWAHMFFCIDDERAMSDINYETMEFPDGKTKDAD